jgi:hypothetical protein
MTSAVLEGLPVALEKCRKTPQLFADNFLGTASKTEYQQKAFETLLNPHNHRVVIGSSNAMGKTHLISESILTAYFLWGPGIEIVTTAPTWNLLESVLWTELRNIYSNAKVNLNCDVTLTKISKSTDPQWFIVGFSPKISTSKDLSTFQGFHGPRATIIVMDEGTGVPKQLYESAERMMTGKNVYWWVIGNTTDKTSLFASLFSKPDWKSIIWNCFDSPNVYENKVTDIRDLRKEAAIVRALSEGERIKHYESYKTSYSSLLTLRWLVEKYIEWGENSFLFQSLALAQFPESNEDTKISFKRIQECMGVFGDPEKEGFAAYNGDKGITIGGDIADVGRDMTCLYTMLGNKQIDKKFYGRRDTFQSAGVIKTDVLKHYVNHYVRVGIDHTGVGAGTYNDLNNDGDIKHPGVEICPLDFGANAKEENKYANLVTEMYAITALDFESEDGFILDYDAELLNELASRKFKYIIKGGRTLLALESKDDFKKRIGHSPDRADAFVMTNYMRHYGKGQSDVLRKLESAQNEVMDAVEQNERQRDW